MTRDDDASGAEHGSTPERAESDGRYVSYETDDGAFVIRDESAPDAWIRSDTVVATSADGD